MAKFRETPCKFYICLGQCQKGRDAEYKGYCQKCSKYEPRAKVKNRNKKKDKLAKEKWEKRHDSYQ